MSRFNAILVAVAVVGTASLGDLPLHRSIAIAQPAKGAAPAFERVREVMNNRFKDMRLTGDPDRDFAAMVIAHHEDLIFLAKTQLEYGGDRQMRQLAQKILNDQELQISELKEWQVRSRQSDYKAQPYQPPPGSGPLDRGPAVAQTAPAPPAPVATAAPAQGASPVQLPLVSGRIENVDAAQGKLTIDHGPIPNLNMDGMTMVFRAADPAMVKSVKKGDRIQFSADRVNGQITVTKIQKAK